MADEPNTRMDEMLKAYAGKRRQEAGAPLELHPATRQMLQGEVARTYKQAPRVSWLQRVITFWPRVAFAATCVVITLTIVLIVLPRQSVMEMAQTTPLAERSAGGERDGRTSDKEKAEKLLDAYAYADAPATPAPSTAPVAPSRPLDRLAKNEADELKAKSEVLTEARKDTDGVRLMREESVGKEFARRSYANKAESSRARYNQKKQDVQLGAQPERAQLILNSFDLEQTGDKVRVIDEDGSIYVGNVVSNEDAKKRNLGVQSPPVGQAAVVSGPAEQEVTFFAVGTNLSLRQKVSIEANILQLHTNVANAPALVPSQALKPSQSQTERGAAQNTIRGRARVGTNQEMFFEAVPTKP